PAIVSPAPVAARTPATSPVPIAGVPRALPLAYPPPPAALGWDASASPATDPVALPGLPVYSAPATCSQSAGSLHTAGTIPLPTLLPVSNPLRTEIALPLHTSLSS